MTTSRHLLQLRISGTSAYFLELTERIEGALAQDIAAGRVELLRTPGTTSAPLRRIPQHGDAEKIRIWWTNEPQRTTFADMCQQLSGTNPLEALPEINNLQCMPATEQAHWAHLIDRARELLGYWPVLQHRFEPFLRPLPQGEKYSQLHLEQNLMRSYLSLDVLLKNPRLIEGALQTAFTDYRRHYRQLYMTEWAAYQKQVHTAWDAKPQLEKHIEALHVLDQLPELGRAVAPLAAAEIENFFAQHSRSTADLATVRARVDADGFFQDYALGAPLPEKAFKALQKTIQKLFARKIAAIKQGTIKQVMTESTGSSARKLLTLLQLSQLEELVQLLTNDPTGHVLNALRKIMNPT